MSKYNKFEDFMQAVINEADRKCKCRYSKSLTDAYDVNALILKMINILISNGWKIFLAVVALLLLGPFGFSIAMATFASTPVGMVAIGALAVVGGITAIRTLYRNRILPIAVKETGQKFRDRFYDHINEYSYIDSLLEQAAECLLSKATKLL